MDNALTVRRNNRVHPCLAGRRSVLCGAEEGAGGDRI